MKCLPQFRMGTANGIELHDWHAETIAIRAFNRFLLAECAHLIAAGVHSTDVVSIRTPVQSDSTTQQPFTIQDDVRIHMYCSELPCGDASMELTMKAQHDPTPWIVRPSDESELEGKSLLGRGFFSELGRVRRKPCRMTREYGTNATC
jgi:tRNA-specific adenosine deaminase 1